MEDVNRMKLVLVMYTITVPSRKTKIMAHTLCDDIQKLKI